MNISGANSPATTIQSASSYAIDGIRTQQQRLERNVAEVARSGKDTAENTTSRDKSLIEQREIIQSVRANVRSLDAAGQRIGTLLDVKV